MMGSHVISGARHAPGAAFAVLVAGGVTMQALPADGAGDKANWMQGSWCFQDNSETMHVDATGIGFNEHTVCTWSHAPDISRPYLAVLDCANVYVDGTETIKVNQQTRAIWVDQAGPDALRAQLDGQHQTQLRRCAT